jgi:enterochelin esterase-like enzyme
VPAEPVGTAVPGSGALADGASLTFGVADADHALAGVRLRPDLRIAGGLLNFHRVDGGWRLVLDQPPVSRLEYLLELRYRDGGGSVGPDPGNPRQVQGAFGRKSVLEFPGYSPPRWLAAPAGQGRMSGFEPALDGVIPAQIWSPAGSRDDEPLPLLVVHDGPEYDALASLTRYLAAGITGDWLPRLRAVLLSPGPRDRWYSASPRYARALCRSVLPEVASRVAVSRRIGMGTSLGGLAMLHAHCLYPDAFDALFLQSGSFFVPYLDRQERRFPYYRRITGFVAEVHSGGFPASPVPAVLTCGAVEENVANNRLMTATLRTRGYRAQLHEVPDAHNYTAWRDAFDPYLTRLLRRLPP